MTTEDVDEDDQEAPIADPEQRDLEGNPTGQTTFDVGDDDAV